MQFRVCLAARVQMTDEQSLLQCEALAPQGLEKVAPQCQSEISPLTFPETLRSRVMEKMNQTDVLLDYPMVVGDPCSKSGKNLRQRLAHHLLFLFQYVHEAVNGLQCVVCLLV